MKCQNCGRENDGNAKFCVQCGSTLSTLNYPGIDPNWKTSKEGKFLIQYFATRKKNWIISKLVKKFKMSSIDAERLYESLKTEIEATQRTPEFRRNMAKQGIQKMITGPLWAIAGTAVTVYSFTHPSSSGAFYIFWGAVIWGIIDFFQGLSQWLKYREKTTTNVTLTETQYSTASAASPTKKGMRTSTKIALAGGVVGVAVIIVLLVVNPSSPKPTLPKPTPTSSTTIIAGSISGRVVDENNKPISGAIVNASDFGNTKIGGGSATTDASGNYHIKGLASGNYRVNVFSTGRVRKYWQNTTDYSSATPVSITAPKDKADINFTLEPSMTISGTVTNSSGVPLPDVSVMISPAGGGTSNVVTTDQNGVYTTNGLGLPLGSYKISAPAHASSGIGDNNYATKYYNNKPGSASADLITLTLNVHDAKGINFTLDIGGSISGRVLNENDQPINGAHVYASVFGTNEPSISSATTDASGNYHIMGLGSGNYRVYAISTGMVTKYWQNTSNYSSATPISVTAPNDKTGIDFTLNPGGTISGTVTNTSGMPLANISVRFSSIEGVVTYVAITNQSGVFTSPVLNFGSYKVNAPSSSYKLGSGDDGYIIKYYDNKPDSASADLVSLSADVPNVNGINFIFN